MPHVFAIKKLVRSAKKLVRSAKKLVRSAKKLVRSVKSKFKKSLYIKHFRAFSNPLIY